MSKVGAPGKTSERGSGDRNMSEVGFVTSDKLVSGDIVYVKGAPRNSSEHGSGDTNMSEVGFVTSGKTVLGT